LDAVGVGKNVDILSNVGEQNILIVEKHVLSAAFVVEPDG
jgi:hypothetical protein